MSYKALFADTPQKATTKPSSTLTEWANIIMNGPRESEEERAARMEYYDRELFEGLFLRYGKAWVNEQMAQLIRRFPSYRQG